MDEKLCVDEQVIPFKSTQSHSVQVYQEQAKDTGYKPLQVCDSLQIVYNSELEGCTMNHVQLGSTNKCQVVLQCVTVPSTISH